MALSLCLGLALPIVLSLYSDRVANDTVEAAPADAFAVTQSIVMSATPDIRLDRGSIAFVDAAGHALPTIGAKGLPAPQPSQNLRLFNPTIAIGRTVDKAAPSAPNPTSSLPAPSVPAPLSPLADALTSGRWETLSLRRATIVLHGFLENPESLTEVRAEVSLRRRGLIAIKGTGLMRGHPVVIDATANVGQAEKRGAVLHRIPLKVSIKGEQIDFTFDGRMVLAPDAIELHGQSELILPSGRGLARWFGARWPSGPGLRDVSVRGQLRLSRHTLEFEKAVARMDGNEGTGVIGLRLRQPRPVVTGTLAYKSIDAKHYLASSSWSPTDVLSWSNFAAGALTVPLGMHLDADLRISADRIQLGAFELGRTAATIALKDGRLLADVAELKFDGGEGGGQLTADFAGITPKVTVRGKLEHVELGQLTTSLAGAQLVQGKAGIVVDLAGSGSTLHDVMRNLTGKVAVRGQSPGRLSIDLRALATTARQGDSVGWGAATRGSTAYENLDMRLVIRDGTVLTETVETKTSDGAWTAVGVVNILSDRLDLRLVHGAAPAGGHPSLSPPRHTIEISGPLRQPQIKVGTPP
ncbi:MAG: AsmA-like C-terminal region-containing protein [Hyphomicrobium sp.]